MKRFCGLLFVSVMTMFSAIGVNAAQWTVSNNPLFIAQFTSLQSAINSAADGDTIYVYHSPNHHGTITIDKGLTLIGAGYHPSKKSSVQFIINADNVNISGFDASITAGSGTIKVKYLTLSNILGGINLVNVEKGIIYNSMCTDINTTQLLVKDFIVTNCFIQFISGTDKAHILVTNNNFPRNSTCGSTRSVFSNSICVSTKAITIENNIFVNGTPSLLEFSSINNNLTFNTAQNTLPYGNNNGTGNIANQDPKFIGNITYSLSVHEIINNNFDYRLANDSPAINAGTDSTDIGVTGGLFPWPRNANGTLDYTGAPRIPNIEYFQLKNTVVGTEGTLRFNVKGTKSK
ncbi:MAG: hypothetical protein KGZ71_08870 [Desulfobulbaceae bacterium]|nr:hypothetical protein [Desulfobulbaceae bacterium]